MSSVHKPFIPVHPHGVHCLHVFAWATWDWCSHCREHWEQTCGQLHDARYHSDCERLLARQVLVDLEEGDLPVPAHSDFFDVLISRPNLTPSAN